MSAWDVHDEVAELFAEHALASTGGYSLHEWTCLYESQRRRDYEALRRQQREEDEAFAAELRARQRRAQAKRRARAKAEAPWREMVQLGLRLEVRRRARVSPAKGERAA